ncbi:MAG: glycoside hydrolase family 97 N-terminal domain-containing protein, partial [Chitinophagaceae bacterium]
MMWHSLFSFFFSFLLWVTNVKAQQPSAIIKSPDGKLSVKVWIAGGRVQYAAFRNGMPVVQPSLLGLVRDDEDFSQKLVWSHAPGSYPVIGEYMLPTAKKSAIGYAAN